MSNFLICLTLSLACLSAPSVQAVTFDVQDFGGTVDDGTDEHDSIQAAIDAACVEVAGGAH